MTDADLHDLARTIAFEREIQARTSTRSIPFAFGTAYVNEAYRVRWDSNLLWIDGEASAGELADEADRILGGAGLLHREIRVDDDARGAALADGLRARGYGCDRLVAMRLDRPTDPSLPEVEEVDLETLRPALETAISREPYGDSADTIRILAAFREELVRHAGARFFCARVDGEIASFCDLYRDGPVAQIEDVNTLQEFRNRGLARAVVGGAAREAITVGAELVFLQALEDDWPKELYAKLGFVPIGHVWSFVRTPGGHPKSPA